MWEANETRGGAVMVTIFARKLFLSSTSMLSDIKA
jgi:hypothetical protein